MRLPSTLTIAATLCCLTASVQAWTAPPHPVNNAQVTRQSVLETLLKGGAATAAAVVLTPLSPSPAYAAAAITSLPTGVTYEVIKAGPGPKPDLGELVAIRFAAYYGDRKIDDIYDTPEPYYTVSDTITLLNDGTKGQIMIEAVFRCLDGWREVNISRG